MNQDKWTHSFKFYVIISYTKFNLNFSKFDLNFFNLIVRQIARIKTTTHRNRVDHESFYLQVVIYYDYSIFGIFKARSSLHYGRTCNPTCISTHVLLYTTIVNWTLEMATISPQNFDTNIGVSFNEYAWFFWCIAYLVCLTTNVEFHVQACCSGIRRNIF